jgi:hypothetical protein
MEMRFGKYRGEEISDLPLPYLQWLLTEELLEDDEREEAFTGIALRIRERYSRMRKRCGIAEPLDADTQRVAK